MATGGLLYHHLYPRTPLHPSEFHYPLCGRSALKGLYSVPKRYFTNPPKIGFLHPTLRSIQCLKQEVQAGSDGEAVEWVNKAPQDPMVEFDPVTVFRRIVAERCSASSAMGRAKEEEANLASQTTSPPPFSLGPMWRGKPTFAIIIALLLLAMAGALYSLRSKKGNRFATEPASAHAKDTLKAPGYDRQKLGEDSIKAPDSVLTAMAIGAASVSRPKDATEPTSVDAKDTPKAPDYDRQKLGKDTIKALDSVVTAMAIEAASVSGPKAPSYDRRKLGEDTIRAPDSILTTMAIEDASVSRPEDATEPTLADAQDTPQDPGYDRQKLGEDTIKAPDSVLTAAMAIGDASVGRPEDETEPTSADAKDTLKAPGYDRQKLGEDTIKAPDSVLTAAMAIGDASVRGPEDATEPTSADAKDTLKAPGYDRRKLGEDIIKAPDSVTAAMAIGDASVSRPEDATEPTPADAKDTLTVTGYDRQKLGEDTIKAPDSILTAMAIGAASVSRPRDTTEPQSSDARDTLKAPVYDRRKLGEATIEASNSVYDRQKLGEAIIKDPNSVPTAMAIGDASVGGTKGHISSIYDSLHAPNGNAEESQRSEAVTDFHPVVSAVAVEDMEFDLHGKPRFGQMPSSSGIVEGFTPLKAQNVGIEVTEGPWFGQGVNDTGTLVSAELPEPQSEKVCGLGENQAVPLLDKNTALGAETSALTGIMDGEFDGEVVAVSEEPNHRYGMGQVEEDGGFIFDSRKEALRDDRMTSNEDVREESEKALEAAVPALAIGVGTVGALFGVAGGLQVVGLAALASVFSHDFLWAQSREALWQELNGITDRQKLLDFLAKRNIMRTESENSSL